VPGLSDMTGQTFGRLVVIERAANGAKGNARWLCRCQCGGQKVVSGLNLRSGKTQSCGCLRREMCREMVLERASERSRKEWARWDQALYL
jgi:hypothetical protein